MQGSTTLTLGAVLIFIGTIACGGAPAPQQQHMETQARIHAAEQLGAHDHPKAKLHLRLAQEQTNKAKEQMEDGDNEAAKRTLERAEADADLALALTRKDSAKAKAQRAKKDIQELREREF